MIKIESANIKSGTMLGELFRRFYNLFLFTHFDDDILSFVV